MGSGLAYSSGSAATPAVYLASTTPANPAAFVTYLDTFLQGAGWVRIATISGGYRYTGSSEQSLLVDLSVWVTSDLAYPNCIGVQFQQNVANGIGFGPVYHIEVGATFIFWANRCTFAIGVANTGQNSGNPREVIGGTLFTLNSKTPVTECWFCSGSDSGGGLGVLNVRSLRNSWYPQRFAVAVNGACTTVDPLTNSVEQSLYLGIIRGSYPADLAQFPSGMIHLDGTPLVTPPFVIWQSTIIGIIYDAALMSMRTLAEDETIIQTEDTDSEVNTRWHSYTQASFNDEGVFTLLLLDYASPIAVRTKGNWAY